MPVFEISDLRPYHLGQMSRELRREHARMVMDLKQSPHRALRTYYDRSFFRKAWKIDGKLAAIGGVTGSDLATEGFVWLALAESALRWPVAIVKETVEQLAEILKTKTMLKAYVLAKDLPAQRFAEFLGFENLCPVDDNFLLYVLNASEVN